MLGLSTAALHNFVEDLLEGMNQVHEGQRGGSQALRGAVEDQDRGNNLVEGLAHLPAQLCQLVLGHVEEGILTPAFAPNDVAFRKEGRIYVMSTIKVMFYISNV